MLPPGCMCKWVSTQDKINKLTLFWMGFLMDAKRMGGGAKLTPPPG